MKNYKELFDQEKLSEDKCCQSPCIDIRGGNEVCLNCGMVLDRHLAEDERRAYNNEEKEKRKQTEPRWSNFGSRTIIPKEKIDYNGRSFNVEKKALFSRLSKIQNSLISSTERNFFEAKPRMKQLVSKLSIPKYIHETAWKIYAVAAKKKLTMGRSIDGFISASLYAAIRVHEFPKILEEISDGAMISRKLVVHSLGLILRYVLPELNLNYKPINPEQLIFKFSNELGLPLEIQKNALKLFSNSAKTEISQIGKDPKGLAASAIYLAAKKTKDRKTQTEIAEIAKITEVTLRTRIKEIKSKLDLII